MSLCIENIASSAQCKGQHHCIVEIQCSLLKMHKNQNSLILTDALALKITGSYGSTFLNQAHLTLSSASHHTKWEASLSMSKHDLKREFILLTDLMSGYLCFCNTTNQDDLNVVVVLFPLLFLFSMAMLQDTSAPGNQISKMFKVLAFLKTVSTFWENKSSYCSKSSHTWSTQNALTNFRKACKSTNLSKMSYLQEMQWHC